jgi:rubrerythrin
MNVFQISDVLEFAVRIEEDGEKFYRSAVQIAADTEIKGLFTFLADIELKHKKVFEDMLASLGAYTPAETYPGEYLTYLHEYIDDKVIFRGDLKGTVSSEIKDTVSAINFGLQRELDSIIFYQETKRFVPESKHGLVDKIIEEEREHFALLSRLKGKYTPEAR